MNDDMNIYQYSETCCSERRWGGVCYKRRFLIWRSLTLLFIWSMHRPIESCMEFFLKFILYFMISVAIDIYSDALYIQ